MSRLKSSRTNGTKSGRSMIKTGSNIGYNNEAQDRASNVNEMNMDKEMEEEDTIKNKLEKELA